MLTNAPLLAILAGFACFGFGLFRLRAYKKLSLDEQVEYHRARPYFACLWILYTFGGLTVGLYGVFSG